MPDLEEVISECAVLATVDEESNIVRLVHHTAQEYFERTWTTWVPNAEVLVTRACMACLCYRFKTVVGQKHDILVLAISHDLRGWYTLYL
jgi:hypothetical protein